MIFMICCDALTDVNSLLVFLGISKVISWYLLVVVPHCDSMLLDTGHRWQAECGGARHLLPMLAEQAMQIHAASCGNANVLHRTTPDYTVLYVCRVYI